MWAADVSSKCKTPNSSTKSSNCWHLGTCCAARYDRLYSNRRTLSHSCTPGRRRSPQLDTSSTGLRVQTIPRSWIALLFHNGFQPLLIQNVSADSRLTGLCREFYRRQGRKSKLDHCTKLYSFVS
jgi:hypothetical protein